MYSDELPACLIEQVTEIRDRTFLAVEETHHLFVSGVRARKKSNVIIVDQVPLLFSYRNVQKVRLRARITAE